MDLKKCVTVLFAAAVFLLAPRLGAQQTQDPSQPKSQDQDRMSGMHMGDMHRETETNPDAARSANDAMSSHDMAMNPHMFMTTFRPENPDDQKRATEILDTLRNSIDKYKDYRVALGDGYQIFLPNVPQPHFHFTNYRYAYEAVFAFNPAHPTSLLYKKTSTGYELEGAMYTAPKNATEEELNERVPLSVARWHKHVNLCMPQSGTPRIQVNWKQFGLGGSISTEDACARAGGRWVPQIFNWMVHVYPYEADPSKIWAH